MEDAPRTIEELIAYSHTFAADAEREHTTDPAWQAGMRLESYGDADEAIASVVEMRANHWNTQLWKDTQALLEVAQGLAHWEAVERIVEERQAENIAGTLVDLTTAGGLVQLHDSLNDTNAQRLRTEHIAIKVHLFYELVKKDLITMGFTSAPAH